MSKNRDQFFKWLAEVLKDRNWQFTKCGSKIANLDGQQTINLDTGFWQDPNYATSKPPRWILQLDLQANPVTAALPAAHRADRIGHSNTAQGDKAGLAVRVIVTAKAGSAFAFIEDWEWTLLFLFPYPVQPGSGAQTFDFNPATGVVTYLGQPLPYTFAALFGLRSPQDQATVSGTQVSYGDATNAITSLLQVQPIGASLTQIPAYDLSSDAELSRLKRDAEAAIKNAPPPPAQATTTAAADTEEDDGVGQPDSDIEQNKGLLGIDPAVYRQINAALRSGKQHLMLYGPPGTGKTTLARWVATSLAGSGWTLITGSADWSSQDVIGGYQPLGGGKIGFVPGVLLKEFDRPLIIDELNRCDIDKVIGPLFTVLSGHHTTLPYRVDIEDPASAAYVILHSPKEGKQSHEFAPGPHWRLIATINSIDKASLYQMSYALSRRFGWIYVDAPKDKRGFVAAYLADTKGLPAPAEAEPCALADIWDAVNRVRVLGPAPFIDMMNAVLAIDESSLFFGPVTETTRNSLIDTFEMFVLPLLDGVLRQEAEGLAEELAVKLGIADGSALRLRLVDRLRSVSV